MVRLLGLVFRRTTLETASALVPACHLTVEEAGPGWGWEGQSPGLGLKQGVPSEQAPSLNPQTRGLERPQHTAPHHLVSTGLFRDTRVPGSGRGFLLHQARDKPTSHSTGVNSQGPGTDEGFS